MSSSRLVLAVFAVLISSPSYGESIDIRPAMRLHAFEHYPIDANGIIPAFQGIQNIIQEQTGFELILVQDSIVEATDQQIPIILTISATSSQFIFTQRIDEKPIIFINVSKLHEFQNIFSTRSYPSYNWFGVQSDANPDFALSMGVDGDASISDFQTLLNEGFVYYALAHEVAHVVQGHEGSFGHLNCFSENLQNSESFRKEIESEADALAIRYMMDNSYLRQLADEATLTSDDFIEVAFSPGTTTEERVILAVLAHLMSGLVGMEVYLSDILPVVLGGADLTLIDSEIRMAVAQQLLDCSDSYNTYHVRNLRNLVNFALIIMDTSVVNTLTESDILRVEFLLSGVERQIVDVRRRLLENIQ